MFCGKCGTQNLDAAAFCKNCGARLNGQAKPAVKMETRVPENAQSQRPVVQNKRRQNKDMTKLVGIAAVAVVFLLVFVLFGGRGYKSTIKQYFNATMDGNAKKIVKLLPNKVVDYALEDGGYEKDELDDLIEDVGEELQYSIAMLDTFFGDNWKATYKIAETEKLTGDDLEDIRKEYKEIGVRVSAAKEVKLDLQFKYGDTEQSDTMYVDLIKVGRSWYLDVMNMSLF